MPRPILAQAIPSTELANGVARPSECISEDRGEPCEKAYLRDSNCAIYRSRWPGQQPSPEKVNYIAAQTSTYPTTVYVTGNTSANHQTYEFSSKDAMVFDSAAGCHYRRQ